MSGEARAFAGSVPELYDRYMVPLIFEPYAADLARRMAARAPTAVLEVAAGTGVVTRAALPLLGPQARYTATDLNQAMLDRAAARVPANPRLDPERIRADLAAAGFARIEVEPVDVVARAASARDVAVAFTQGTLLAAEIEARGPGRLAEATDRAEAALRARFGGGPVEGPIRAFVVTADG